MKIKEQLRKLKKKETELFFKEIKHEKIKKGDLAIRDESGINPVFFRKISYEEAVKRIKKQTPVNIVERKSKLGKMYLNKGTK